MLRKQGEREVKNNKIFKMAFDKLLGYANLCKMRMVNINSCSLVTLLDLIYRTYQGFGIILWLVIVGIAPLGFLWLIISVPFPFNTALAFGVAFGFVCVSRSRWRSN